MRIGFDLDISNSLILQRTGTATPTPTPAPTIPAADWRMPATVSVSSGLGASQTALAAAQAGASSKSRPSVAIGAGATEYVEWTVAQAGTALLSWLGQSSATAAVSLNGTDAGFAPAFPAGSSIDGISGTGGRRQFARLAVSVGDRVRLTIAAGASARTIYPLLHKLPASGPWDAHIVFGASREAQGLGCALIEDDVIAANPTRDPLVFNFAVSGQTLSQVVTNAAAAAPIYSSVARYALLGSILGNDVTSGRPYDNGEKAALDAGIASIMGSLSGFAIGFGNTSYRAYSGVTPLAQGDGALPYNDNVVHPAIQAFAPDCYDAALGRARIDEYLTILAKRAALTDEVHGAAAEQRALWRDSWFKRVYAGSWSAVTSQAEQRIASAEASKSTGTTALTNYNEALYALAALQASAGKVALQTRIDAIRPTVLFTEAVRLIDVAAASHALVDKNAAQAALDSAQTAGYSGATDPNTIAFQQARITAITINSFDQLVKVGFGGTGAVTGWNRSNSTATGVILASLNDDGGAATGIGINVTNAANVAGGNTGLVSGVAEVPDAIVANYLSDTSNSFAFTLTGLDPARTYDLLLMPSRSTTTSSSTRFSVNATVLAPDVPANNNVTQYALATNVAPDAGGNIAVNCARGTGSSYVYLSAMILKRRI